MGLFTPTGKDLFVKPEDLKSGTVDQFLQGLAKKESSGNYKALGPVINSGMYTGDRAYGKYQIMGKNVPEWSQKYLGKKLTADQLYQDEKLQDELMRKRAQELYSKYGNWEDVASVHFTGQPLKKAGNVKDQLGTTAPKYVQDVLAFMRGDSPAVQYQSPLTPGMAGSTPAMQNQTVWNTAMQNIGQHPLIQGPLKALDFVGTTIDKGFGIPARIGGAIGSKMAGGSFSDQGIPETMSGQLEEATTGLTGSPTAGAVAGLLGSIAQPFPGPGKVKKLGDLEKIAKDIGLASEIRNMHSADETVKVLRTSLDPEHLGLYAGIKNVANSLQQTANKLIEDSVANYRKAPAGSTSLNQKGHQMQREAGSIDITLKNVVDFNNDATKTVDEQLRYMKDSNPSKQYLDAMEQIKQLKTDKTSKGIILTGKNAGSKLDDSIGFGLKKQPAVDYNAIQPRENPAIMTELIGSGWKGQIVNPEKDVFLNILGKFYGKDIPIPLQKLLSKAESESFTNRLIDSASDPETISAVKSALKKEQEFLKAKYPNGEIKLYRGVGTKKVNEDGFLSSWTDDPAIAQQFAGKGGTVVEKNVPIENIALSYNTQKALGKMGEQFSDGVKALFGGGAKTEREYLVVNKPAPKGQGVAVKKMDNVSVDPKFTGRLKEGYDNMNNETLYRDASKLSYEDFIKKYEAYDMDGGGSSMGTKPAHAVLSKSDVYPTEYDTWDEFISGNNSMTNKFDREKGLKLVDEYYDKKFSPPLVEKFSDTEFGVVDGHHRVANLLVEGQDQFPVYYDSRTLTKIWEKQTGKKVTNKEVKETYKKLFPEIRDPGAFAMAGLPFAPVGYDQVTKAQENENNKETIQLNPFQPGFLTSSQTVNKIEPPTQPPAFAVDQKRGFQGNNSMNPDGLSRMGLNPLIPANSKPDSSAPKPATVPNKPFQEQVIKPANQTYTLRDNKIQTSDEELMKLGAVIYGEIGTREGKHDLEAGIIANTILNRSANRGQAIEVVISEPWQYQAFNKQNYKDFMSGKAQKSQYLGTKLQVQAVNKVLEQIKNGTLENTYGQIENYSHFYRDDNGKELPVGQYPIRIYTDPQLQKIEEWKTYDPSTWAKFSKQQKQAMMNKSKQDKLKYLGIKTRQLTSDN